MIEGFISMTIQKINSNDTVKQVSIEQGKNNTYNKPLDMTQATDSSNIAPPTLTSDEIGSGKIPKGKVDEINKLGRLPDNAFIYYGFGQYNLCVKNSLSKIIGQGTNIIPPGYELKNDNSGYTRVVPKGWLDINMDENTSYKESDIELNNNDLFIKMIPQDQVNKINKERVLPKNALISPEIVANTDPNQGAGLKKTGGFELTLKAALAEGTRTIPEGYELKNDHLGGTTVVLEGWQGPTFDNSKNNVPNSSVVLSNSELLLSRISQEKIDIINKEGVLPDSLLVTLSGTNNQYTLIQNTTLGEGTRKIPKGFELKNNILGFTNIYPKNQEGGLLGSK